MHLAENEEATSILEVGLCLIHAYQKLKFFLEEAEKISSGIKLNINEIVILHIIRIQKKPKSVTVINLLADFYDDYTIAYTIKKLIKLKLIENPLPRKIIMVLVIKSPKKVSAIPMLMLICGRKLYLLLLKKTQKLI